MRRINKFTVFPWTQVNLEMIYETKVSKLYFWQGMWPEVSSGLRIPVAQIMKTRLLIHDTHKVCRKKRRWIK